MKVAWFSLFLQIFICGKSTVKSNKEGVSHLKTIDIVQNIRNITTHMPLLKYPFCSGLNCSNTFPTISEEHYINSPQIYKDKSYQIIMGIVIENYSRYKLQFLTSDTHGNTRHIQKPANVPEESKRLFIFDNSAEDGFGIHGSVSWQIMKCDGKALIVKVSKNNNDNNMGKSKYQFKPGIKIGRRLVLTYYVPFGGKCNTYQRNSFSVNIDPIELDSKEQWIANKNSHMDYYRFYKYNFGFSNDTMLKSYDNGRFLIQANMDGSCATILRVKYFHNLNWYQNQELNNNFENLYDNSNKTTKDERDSAFDGLSFIIGVVTTISIIIILCISIISVKYFVIHNGSVINQEEFNLSQRI